MIIDWASSSTCISKSVAQTSAEYAGWLQWLDGKVFNRNCKVAKLQAVVCCDSATEGLCASPSVSKKNPCLGSVICFVNILLVTLINCFSVLRVSLLAVDVLDRPSKLRYQSLLHTQTRNLMIWTYPIGLWLGFLKRTLVPLDTSIFSSLTLWVQRSVHEVHRLSLNSRGKIRHLGKYLTHVLSKKINANQ